MDSLRHADYYMGRLRALTDELRQLRDRFGPIYRYYFPPSWATTLARALRLKKMPDYTRYAPELQELRDGAWRIIEESKAAFESLAPLQVPLQVKQMAQLAYHQIYYDGNVIVLMNEFTKAMANTDPEAAVYFGGMKEMSDKAQENLRAMQGSLGQLTKVILDARGVDTSTFTDSA
jgi:hypothetical protein